MNTNKRFSNFVFTWNIDTEIEKDVLISQFKPLDYVYLIISLEKAKTGQLHYQGYCELKGQRTFKTIKKALPVMHFETRKGTQKQAIDYCIKLDTDYDDGSTVISRYIEDGEPKIQSFESKRTDIEDFVQAIQDDLTDFELMVKFPKQYLLYQQKIQTIRNTILEEKYKKVFRKMEVFYIYGKSGSGKSRYVFEKYPNAYRVSSYHTGAFDSYQNEDVIVLEEFRGDFPIAFLLQLLDGYPMRLPARYQDKVACHTKVFILTNIPLCEQYQNVAYETIQALERRITEERYLISEDITKDIEKAKMNITKDILIK